MKIVALDTHVTDFDGLSWQALAQLGELQCFPRTSREQVLERASEAEALIVNKVLLDAELFSKLPSLRYVGVTATGVNNVDLLAAKEQGVVVTNVAGYSTDSVAQIVFAYMLQHQNAVTSFNQEVQSGAWVRSEDFCFHSRTTFELSGKVLGIVGYGTIGKRVAELARAFGMQVVIGNTPGREASSERLSLSELFQVSDFVSLHCALSEHTEGFVNKALLAQAKTSTVLINTGRGGLLNETDVATALNEGRIAHAYLDVLSSEPPAANNPLLSAENVTITPHIAWATKEARERLVEEVAKNLSAFQSGEPRNVVN